MKKSHDAVIASFVSACRDPILIEPGEEPFELAEGSFVLDQGRIQVWDEHRNLVRAVLSIKREEAGRLELEVRRFGAKNGRLLLLDRARARNHAAERRAARDVFREKFRLMAARNFPGWTVDRVSSEADLEHTLPGGLGRALVKRGGAAWAVLGVPDDATAANGAMTYGLIWLDYLRRIERKLLVQGLALFLPAGRELTSCLRIRCLNPRSAQFSVFMYGRDNWEEQIDVNLHGNLETTLHPAGTHAQSRRIPPLPPEAELERRLRRQIQVLDAGLLPEPVYGQVPALAGMDRGIIDLLAATNDGRLSVLELKAVADQHLPMQALDYWMRVRWHNQRGEFSSHGYFPGVPLSSGAPRLLLVAPSLAFHPTTETLLRYYSPDIEVERVGLGVEWQKEIAVRFRLRGAHSPV